MKLTAKDLPGHCHRCGKGGYAISRALDGRPQFACGHCGASWTNGRDGDPYITPAGRAALSEDRDGKA